MAARRKKKKAVPRRRAASGKVETLYCAVIVRGKKKERLIDCYPTAARARAAARKGAMEQKKDDKRSACVKKCGG